MQTQNATCVYKIASFIYKNGTCVYTNASSVLSLDAIDNKFTIKAKEVYH